MLTRHGAWTRLEMRLPESAYAPCGFAAGDNNLYRYVGNAPTNKTDPSGLKDEPLSVPIDKNCTDTAGPDVTEWFLKDLRAHEKRLQDFRKDKRADQYAEEFRLTVKYYLSYKWMSFEVPSTSTGKGANVVTFAGVPIRKNQLGNIAFGYLCTSPGLLPTDKMNVAWAYTGGVVKYEKQHPHSENWGKYVDLKRVDNLAAFSLGAHMASLPNRGELSVKDWGKIIAAQLQFKNNNQLFSKYADLYAKGTELTLDNLTFIPEYGGFNTRSLKPAMKDGKPVVYSKNTSSYTAFLTAYGESLRYGVAESKIDAKLQEELEDYWGPTVPKK